MALLHTFRPATALDARAIATLRCEQYPSSKTVEETTRQIEVAWPLREAENQRTFVVMIEGCVVVGACTLRLRTHMTRKRSGELHDVLVAKAHRNKGHGYSMVRRALQEAFDVFKCVTVGVVPETAAAGEFYKRAGFVACEGGALCAHASR